jgi:hypothetical protein
VLLPFVNDGPLAGKSPHRHARRPPHRAVWPGLTQWLSTARWLHGMAWPVVSARPRVAQALVVDAGFVSHLGKDGLAHPIRCRPS